MVKEVSRPVRSLAGQVRCGHGYRLISPDTVRSASASQEARADRPLVYPGNSGFDR